MGKYYCSIVKCHNFSGITGKFSKKVTLHKLPKDSCTKKAWMTAISRQNWFPTAYTRVRNKIPTENLPQRKVVPKHERKQRILRQPLPENIPVTSALHFHS